MYVRRQGGGLEAFERLDMITVVVDTTATFIDVTMKTTPWIQLLTLCKDAVIDLVVSDVVLRETARHWEAEALQAIETANKRIDGITKSRERLTEFGLDATSLVDSAPVSDIPDKAKYLEKTREKLLSLEAQVPAVPDHVDIETLLVRDLHRRKPFNDSGKGFRDTLVWETLKPVVLASETGDTIFFITNNTKDYCDDAGDLAPELLAEIDIADGELVLVANLDALLVRPEFVPLIAALAQSEEQLAEFLKLAVSATSVDTDPPSLDQIVKDAVLSAIDGLTTEDVMTMNDGTTGLNFTDLDIPGELEGLTIDVVEPDESTLTWQTYETFQDTTLLIQAEVEADVSLDGYAYKGDAHYLADSGDIHVLDWDWNRSMVNAVTSTRAKLIFQIRLEQGANVADDCELEGAHRIDNDDPHSLT